MIDSKTRRALRRALGSRTQRRAGTKSMKAKQNRPQTPRARLAIAIRNHEKEHAGEA